MTSRAFLAAAVTLSLIACGGGGPGGSGAGSAGGGAAGNEILVGEYSSLTGGTATFGQSTHNGILLAFDEATSPRISFTLSWLINRVVALAASSGLLASS